MAPQFTRQMYHSGWPTRVAVSISSSGDVAPGTYETGGGQGVMGSLLPVWVPLPWTGCGGPAQCGAVGPHLLPPTEPLVCESRRASRAAGQGHLCPLRHHLRLRLHRDADHVLDCGRGERPAWAESPVLHHPIPSCPIPTHNRFSSPNPAHLITSHTSVLSQPSHPTLSLWHIQCYPIYPSHLASVYPIPLCSILSHPIPRCPNLSCAIQSDHIPSYLILLHPSHSTLPA